MNTKHTNKINRMKATRFGKIVCRLMGEEQGAVMMEYVIIAVMIAAAVALGAWFFGAQILGMFGVAGDAATGRHKGARDNTAAIQKVKSSQNSQVLKAAQDFSDDPNAKKVTAGK